MVQRVVVYSGMPLQWGGVESAERDDWIRARERENQLFDRHSEQASISSITFSW